MDELLVGIMGAGGMGRALARGAIASGRARVAAIADPVDGLAEAAAAELTDDGSIDAYSDAADMLARDDIVAVFVAVPNHLHADAVRQVAAAGKHCFCEKPMALNVADARAMIEACENAGVKLMIGQVLRYNVPFVWMIEKVRSGELGQPFAMQVTRIGGGWGGVHGQPWRKKKETAGGPLFEVAAHEIDFIRQILGEASSVYAAMGNYVNPELDYEDLAQVTIRFRDGGQATLLSGHAAKFTCYDGKIFCTDGQIVFSHQAGEVRWVAGGGEVQTHSYAEVGEGYERGVDRETREFIEAVLNDTEVTIPGLEGLRNTEIAQAAQISAAANRAVDLPL